MSELTVDDLEVSWEPERSDYVAAFNARNRTWAGWKDTVVLPLEGVWLLLLGLLFGWSWLVIVGATVLGVFVVLSLPARLLSGRRAWRLQPVLREPCRLRLSRSEGLTLTAASAWSGVRWMRVARVRESTRDFVFEMESRPAQIIVLPKRVLSAAQVLEARAIIHDSARPGAIPPGDMARFQR